MKRKLIALCLLPLLVLGQWEMDFDEDWAAAITAVTKPKPFTITFITGTPPTNITLNANYAGPSTASLALYDSGDGVWHEYTSRIIPVVGSYVAFKGDWRTAAGTYANMFNASLASTNYTCELSGRFTVQAAAQRAYDAMFRDNTAVTAILGPLLPPLTGQPYGHMLNVCFRGCGKVKGSLPAGFLDTSGLTGAPAPNMFYDACNGMSGVTGPLPSGFFDTSGLTGAPANGMFGFACNGMSGVTGPLPSGFFDTSGLTGAPAPNMFRWSCYGMSGVTGPFPSGFLDTSGLTGAPAERMFEAACYGMSGVTGPFPSGFLDTSGLTGAPAQYMFESTFCEMTSIVAVDFTIGSGVAFTSANVPLALVRMFCYDAKWTGNVYWGTNLLTTAIPVPDVRTLAFRGCTSKPNFASLNANWK